MRILIVWPHSGRNAGDRALVEEACRLARRRYPGAAVAVALNDPAGWRGPRPAEIVPSLKTWLAEVSPAGEQTWHKGRLPWAALRLLLAVLVFRLTGRCWRFGSPDQRRLLERYCAADLVLGSGGNHLYARHWLNLTFFWTWLSLALAIMLGKRVIILPQSIGPLHGPLQRLLVRWLLDRAELAMVREPASLRAAHALWPRRLPVLRPDMAFGFAGDPPAVGAE
ncbi:MAG TPA: polysaccharide pyruvyl transferase family protein, partial [Herpetosiphonaceae bacterium]